MPSAADVGDTTIEKKLVKKLYYAAATYAVLGLLSGLAYREITKAHDFVEGKTQLAFMHTHLLALGMLFFLIVLLLERAFALSRSRTAYNVFFWAWNAGLIVTVAMMAWHGYLQVEGRPESDVPEAIPGIAGMGHMLLTVGLVAFFVALHKALFSHRPAQAGATTVAGSTADAG